MLMDTCANIPFPGISSGETQQTDQSFHTEIPSQTVSKIKNIGLDIGSTTIKLVGLDERCNIVFCEYERHFSDVKNCLLKLLHKLNEGHRNLSCKICITGSGGIAIARDTGVTFLQEVLACNHAISREAPEADVIIELGGEDAKLTYLGNGLEQRMNETCAGGTGAFIDQMAAFIGTDAAGLDALALKADMIYPIASRCGVFAKSDILPLINEGCNKENIAASIMQAVVNQTIGGLAQGRPIEGCVVFLGGPLHFLSSLKKRFVASLAGIEKAIFPENGHFFVALGAALHSKIAPEDEIPLNLFISLLEKAATESEVEKLPALFNTEQELQNFRQRHANRRLNYHPLARATGKAWLGIDSGSTTIKAALIDEQNRILHSFYSSNKGDPLKAALKILGDIYTTKNPDLQMCGACATGYGSAMIVQALRLDIDEVETVAHFSAASFFDPDVSFILDIGGQDIKCMHVKKGTIDKISLNEACSAGCGSFIENFANSLGLDLPSFAHSALFAKQPADLGTRCTVFMNSRVRQAQKEGVEIGDIAAGLSYSVVRNAIFKVMKIADVSSLGKHIVVQGGAFLNEAILRALELELNTNVVRPAESGLMGAFGAALIAKKRCPTGPGKILSPTELANFNVQTKIRRCTGCSNSCLLTISNFDGKRHYISGNRCERGAQRDKNKLPNLYAWKYRRLFSYQPIPVQQAKRGIIGIPRALNIYENYPLWFTLFSTLGFHVALSAESSRELYYSAYDTIPSQTVCYPAKLAHGHVFDLISKGIKNIFFPCIQREQKDADFRHGIYNCPVVVGYSELINNNMGLLREKGINLIHEFLPLDRNMLAERLAAIPLFSAIAKSELENAVNAGFAEMENYRLDLRKAGEDTLKEIEETNSLAIVLAGHPYHIDPEIQHGIADLVNSCGMAVLTEDSVSHLMPDPGQLRVVDQWAYHSRLYRAGAFAGTVDNIAVLQLLSFGCGIDAITSDQLEEIVSRNDRLYAQIKIDEGGNLGPARIRIRSLRAAMLEKKEKSRTKAHSPSLRTEPVCPVFTPEMRHTHTLLVPQMSPMHFQFAREIFASEGYDAQLLQKTSRSAVDTGLRHVNNDACYPAIIVIGQLLEAVKSGKYNPDKIALVISQTGGGCRATNYIAFLRKALVDAGLGHIPIANFSTNIGAPGIRPTWKLLKRLIMAGHYGDALMRVTHRMRPYEKEKGAVNNLAREWSAKAAKNIESGSLLDFQRNMLTLIRDFDALPTLDIPRKPRVGLVGEILLKYHPYANNNAAAIIEEEGGEAVVTDIVDFLLYGIYDQIFNYEKLSGTFKKSGKAKLGINFLEMTRLCMRYGFSRSKHFSPPAKFRELRDNAKKVISLGHQMGEGWLLSSEMVHMLESGINRILCMQPFGCLPNHIVGKGLIRALMRKYPNACITPLDYDSGTSEVNQINRIKLLMHAGSAKADQPF